MDASGPVEQAVIVVADRHRSLRERLRAAEDLADYPAQEGFEALVRVAEDPDADPELSMAVGRAVARVAEELEILPDMLFLANFSATAYEGFEEGLGGPAKT